MARNLVCGDIHGNIKAIKQVIQRVDIKNDDTIVFLGDYVDGWDWSYEVIEYITSLPCNKVFLRGNHDDWMLEWLSHGEKKIKDGQPLSKFHSQNGGKSTYKNYTEAINEDKINFKKHLDFFLSLKLFHIDNNNNLYVHGGIIKDPYTDHPNVLMWDRELFANTISGIVPEAVKQYRKVFIGHTGTGFYGHTKPFVGEKVVCMDTDGGWNGSISIMDVDTLNFWQSDINPVLYDGRIMTR